MAKRPLECNGRILDGSAPGGPFNISNSRASSKNRVDKVGAKKNAIPYMVCYLRVASSSMSGVDTHIALKTSGYCLACVI